MKTLIAKLPKMRLLANPLAEVPTVFSITSDNERELRAFLRKIPELKGEPGDSITGDEGKEGRRGRRGERGSPPDVFVKGIGGGYELRFADPRGEPAVIKHGAKGEIGPMPGHEVGDRQFRMQLPNGNWGPWIRQVPGPKGDKGDKGDTGDTGPAPGHEFNGSRLRFRLPDGTWGEFVDLRGPTGAGGGGGRGRSASELYSSIALNGTDLEFRRATAGPLGPDKIVDLSGLAQSGATLSGVWQFEDPTAEADPGDGNFRLDQGTFAATTEIFLAEENKPGADFSNIITFLNTGDRLYIQEVDNASNAVVFELTGPAVDNGSWQSIPVTVVLESGFLTDGVECAIVFLLGGGGSGGGTTTRNISIENVELNDEFVFMRAPANLTLTRLSFVIQGTGSPSATVFVRFGPDRSAPATNAVDAGTVVTSTTTGDVVTSFDNADVDADDWIIVEVTAVGGTTRNELSLTMEFS